MNKRNAPLIDKLYYLPLIFTGAVMLPITVITAVFDPIMLLCMLPIDLLCLYFFISPLFGYVELGESCLVIRFGLLLRREIPYASIRGTVRGRGIVGEAFLTLKYGMEHLHIKYGVCDITTVSVTDNDGLAAELAARIAVKNHEKVL